MSHYRNQNRRSLSLNIDDAAAWIRLVLAGNVRAECGRRDLSGLDLAKATGMDRSTVSRKWRGLTAWTLTDLALIASVVGADPAKLLQFVPDANYAGLADGVVAPINDIEVSA